MTTKKTMLQDENIINEKLIYMKIIYSNKKKREKRFKWVILGQKVEETRV